MTEVFDSSELATIRSEIQNALSDSGKKRSERSKKESAKTSKTRKQADTQTKGFRQERAKGFRQERAKGFRQERAFWSLRGAAGGRAIGKLIRRIPVVGGLVGEIGRLIPKNPADAVVKAALLAGSIVYGRSFYHVGKARKQLLSTEGPLAYKQVDLLSLKRVSDIWNSPGADAAFLKTQTYFNQAINHNIGTISFAWSILKALATGNDLDRAMRDGTHEYWAQRNFPHPIVRRAQEQIRDRFDTQLERGGGVFLGWKQASVRGG